MLLSYLGIGKDLTTIGLVWYYFNVIAIAAIVYKLLDLAAIRAKNASTNKAETQSKEDKLFIKFVMFVSAFGIVYFFTREYIQGMKEIWNFAYEGIRGLING